MPAVADHTPPAAEDLVAHAVDIAKGAGEVTLRWFRSPTLEVETKGDGSPVTQADKATETYIRERIAEVAPGSSIVGEEHGSSVDGASGLTWYVDPIDGTKGFARGVPLYATLIGVEDAHGMAVGVVHIPATGETVWAGRGLGAFTDDGPAHVSNRSELWGAYATTSSVSRWGCGVYSRMDAAGVEIRGWGDGYGFLMAATGRVEAMIDLGAGNRWDFAPMPVIFQEAGGRYSTPDGVDTIDTASAIASNGLLHDQIRRLVTG